MKNIVLIFSFFLIAGCASSSKSGSSPPFKFTESNFQKNAIDNKGLTVVEFWATWCGPCKMLNPIIEDVSNDLGNTTRIGKVNVDLEPEIAMKYGIRSIPTILFFKDGEVVEKYVGVISKRDLKEKIEKLL